MLKKKIQAILADPLFEKNKPAIMERNHRFLNIALLTSILIFSLVLLSSFFSNDQSYFKNVYVMLLSVSIGLFILQKFLKVAHCLTFSYLAYAALFLYSIITGAFVWPDYICITILALLFLCPIMFLDKSWRINLITISSALIYLVMVYFYKNPAIIFNETVNTLSFLFLGCLIGSFTRRTQIENFDIMENLRMSEEQYRLLLKQTTNIVCRYDVADQSVNMNPETAAVFKMPEKVFNVPAEPVKLGNIAPESIDAYVQFYESILAGQASGTASFQTKTVGGWTWYKATYSTIFSNTGKPVHAMISLVDITEQREKELVYRKWQQEVAALSREKTALFEWNLSRDLSEGSTGELIGDFRNLPSDTFNNRTAVYAQTKVYRQDKNTYLAFLNREHLLGLYYEGINSCELDYREILAEEDYRWLHLEVQLVPYPDSKEIKAFLIIKDIDQEKRQALALEAQAREDALTRLLNRATFEQELSLLLSSSSFEVQYAFVILDIDGFKNVNDTLGHVLGDEFLIMVAEQLRAKLRQQDLIGRLGGDEFAFCLRNIENKASIEERLHNLGQSLDQELAEGVRVSASLGVAMFPQDGLSFEELYKKADQALYQAKKAGRNQFKFYANQ